MIYLDSAATTQMADEVLQAMMPYLKEEYGNAGSSHRLGRAAADAVAKAREKVAHLMGASPENIIFTSGGSEGNNFALHARADELLRAGKNHMIVSSVEHDSVIRAAESLVKCGFHITYLPVNKFGCVELQSFLDALTPETGLVSVMYVNNETGAVNPVRSIGKRCAEQGILFHTDCVQAAGLHDIREIPCDFMTISSHKIHGPKGIGAVYIRQPEQCLPMIYGGHMQEFGLRGGTENVPAIVGFGAAAELYDEELIDDMAFLRRIMWESLHKEFGDTVHLNGFSVGSYGKILNVRFDGVDAETLLYALDSVGICASSGSACRTKEPEPSRTLTAMGLSADEARNAVRFSFSGMNTREEIEDAVEIISLCVKLLRGDGDSDVE